MHFLIENYWWFCAILLLFFNLIPDVDLSFKKREDNDIDCYLSLRRYLSAIIIFLISNIMNVKFAAPASHYITGVCIMFTIVMFYLDSTQSRITGIIISFIIALMPYVILPYIFNNF